VWWEGGREEGGGWREETDLFEHAICRGLDDGHDGFLVPNRDGLRKRWPLSCTSQRRVRTLLKKSKDTLGVPDVNVVVVVVD
jgi:hypothetical protein